MNSSETQKILLKSAIGEALEKLRLAKEALDEFESLPENNIFDNLSDAGYHLYEILEERAEKDCEGKYNCGKREYKQKFIVDKKLYIAIYTPEYNRHDKTYYYIDDAKFIVKELINE
jgi:hypothetical protein